MKTMQEKMRRTSLLFSTLLAALFLVACGTTKIADVNHDPGRYAGKEITISGRVATSVGIFKQGAFEVDDGTGKMWVLSDQFGVPAQDTSVKVTGTVESGATIVGEALGTILRETRPR
ncbi:MAG: hypothetical protein KGL59_10260 [Acidobacteriota bacterium]|nr:hypothetical protein [Acidobacteriota bacterium]